MDLGATICTRSKPQCLQCPVRSICQGLAQGDPEKYPVKTKKLKRSVEHLSLLWAQKPDGSVWLERRPASGIWGGLYCLPVFENQESLLAFLPARNRDRTQVLPTFKHVLTHLDWTLHPLRWTLPERTGAAQVAAIVKPWPTGRWFDADQALAAGLPAPLRMLLLDAPG